MGQNLRAEQIAVMLFSLLKKDAEERLGEAFTKAVVTIPANSKGLARHSTKLCAGAAGLQVLTLINEPTAAAICYGLNTSEDQTILVYDFGGGTLDVTVLRIHRDIFEEISTLAIHRLISEDLLFDAFAIDHYWDQLQSSVESLRQKWENPKMFENFEATAGLARDYRDARPPKLTRR